MRSLLDRVTATEVVPDPFPHVVVENALDADVYERLASSFPSFELMAADQPPSNRDPGSNRRFNYLTTNILRDPRVDDVWRDFSTLHASEAFFREVVTLMREPIAVRYPDLARRLESPEPVLTGIRKRDTHDDVDVLMVARAELNTPTGATPSSVRRVHVDLPSKLYIGLYYMPSPTDTSTGGDLELYRLRDDLPPGLELDLEDVPDEYVETVVTVGYAPNTFFLALNCPEAMHGVTVRSASDEPRRYAYLTAEVAQPLFDYRSVL